MIADTAVGSNSNARLALSADDDPRLVFWGAAAAPPDYERFSRQRMIRSGVPKLVNRAGSRSPVEGYSEIDVALESRSFLVFLEAKLGSDISVHTTYDPGRNQIARNIDCLLESAAGRTPVFWMLVRDTRADRMYVQLIEQYRSQPTLLERELPHRDPKALQGIAERLAILRWSDLGAGWIHQPLEDPLVESVRVELMKRIAY